MEVIRLEQVSLWRRTQEEFSYDLKKTILSILQGKYRQPGWIFSKCLICVF